MPIRSNPLQPNLHPLLRDRLHQRDVLLAASLECLPQVLGHRHDESSGMATYNENYDKRPSVRKIFEFFDSSPCPHLGLISHWLVSVKLHSHLVSGSLFFQGVHKNIFEIV